MPLEGVPTTRGGLEPAVIVNQNTGLTVPCMFNPFEYTITKINKYQTSETKGKNIPKIRFQQGGAKTLKLRLFFDTYGEGIDVRAYTAGLWEMMMVDQDLEDRRTGKGEPPHCLFIWGAFEFEAVITKLTENMTLFLKDGTPVRSVVDLSLQQIVDDSDFARQNPTSGGGAAPKTRAVSMADRLDLIAWEEYGDCNEWRRIAEANQIIDPLRLRPGTALSIPPIE